MYKKMHRSARWSPDSGVRPGRESRSLIPGRVRSAALMLAAAQARFVAGMAPARAQTVDAIWKTHRVTFQFSSSNTAYYTCHGLATRLKAILRSVGAHKDITVVTHCDEVTRLLKF